MSKGRRRQGRRRSVVTLSMFAMLLLVAGNASAATQHTQNYTTADTHPCTGEPLAVEGHEHFTSNSKPGHINTHRRVAGQATGVMDHRFTYGDQLKINMKTPPGSVYIRSWKKVISQQREVPDFMLMEVIHFHPDGSPAGTKTNEKICR